MRFLGVAAVVAVVVASLSALLPRGDDADALRDAPAVVVNAQGAVGINVYALRRIVLTSRGDARPITGRLVTDRHPLGAARNSADDRVLACQGYELYAADTHQIDLWERQVDAIMDRYGLRARRAPGSDPCAFMRHVEKIVLR